MEVQRIPCGPIMTNSYLIPFDSQSSFILDPADGQTILYHLKSCCVQPAAILLTHGHWDHITGISLILEQFPALPIFVHPEDQSFLFDAVLNGSVNFYAPFQLDSNIPIKHWEEFSAFAGENWRVMETPGHTNGSVTIQIQNHLFTGDFLFQETIGRTDFQFGSAKTMHQTLKQFMADFKDSNENYTIHPGHGDETDLFHELQNNPFLVRMTKQMGQ